MGQETKGAQGHDFRAGKTERLIPKETQGQRVRHTEKFGGRRPQRSRDEEAETRDLEIQKYRETERQQPENE